MKASDFNGVYENLRMILGNSLLYLLEGKYTRPLLRVEGLETQNLPRTSAGGFQLCHSLGGGTGAGHSGPKPSTLNAKS